MRRWTRLSAALLVCCLAMAQKPSAQGAPQWRQTFNGILSRPPGTVNARDLRQMESELAMAGQYCVGLTPGDYQANRELVGRMAAYMASVQAPTGDRRMNASLNRIAHSLAAFPCAYAPAASGPAPPPPEPVAANPGDPPFSLKAPELERVQKAELDQANDLRDRYNGDAARAANAWRNAVTIHQNLQANGMGLNADTAASLDRLKLDFDGAEDALRGHKWDDALASLQAAEYETRKIAKAVGN